MLCHCKRSLKRCINQMRIARTQLLNELCPLQKRSIKMQERLRAWRPGDRPLRTEVEPNSLGIVNKVVPRNPCALARDIG